jgi:hypothetical protein
MTKEKDPYEYAIWWIRSMTSMTQGFCHGCPLKKQSKKCWGKPCHDSIKQHFERMAKRGKL